MNNDSNIVLTNKHTLSERLTLLIAFGGVNITVLSIFLMWLVPMKNALPYVSFALFVHILTCAIVLVAYVASIISRNRVEDTERAVYGTPNLAASYMRDTCMPSISLEASTLAFCLYALITGTLFASSACGCSSHRAAPLIDSSSAWPYIALTLAYILYIISAFSVECARRRLDVDALL